MLDTEKNHFPVLCDFIDDGYTHATTIEAEAGSNGPLSFTYRPALPEQVSKLIDAELPRMRAIALRAGIQAE